MIDSYEPAQDPVGVTNEINDLAAIFHYDTATYPFLLLFTFLDLARYPRKDSMPCRVPSWRRGKHDAPYQLASALEVVTRLLSGDMVNGMVPLNESEMRPIEAGARALCRLDGHAEDNLSKANPCGACTRP